MKLKQNSFETGFKNVSLKFHFVVRTVLLCCADFVIIKYKS